MSAVTFTADDGVELRGVLRVATPGAPAIALTGPFTGVKDQVTGTYAERLHDAGLTTLAFDHRGWGESGGRSGHEDTQGKLADLRAAVTLLIVHGTKDDYCSPELARQLYDRATGRKEIHWLDTTCHIDLYDTEPYVTRAVDLTADFFKKVS
jgi:fermentation-respiration switch protein FrsA (DUF1100 family)